MIKIIKDLKIIKDKIYFFYKEKQPVHITYENRRYFNCNVIEISADFFIGEDILNKDTIPVFYKEIFNVDIFREVNKGIDKNGM